MTHCGMPAGVSRSPGVPLATVARAGSIQDIESSAIVSGTVVLTRDGTVQTAVIDDAAKYGQAVADMVRKAALQWRFEPVLRHGKPVVAKAACLSGACSKDIRRQLQRMDQGRHVR